MSHVWTSAMFSVVHELSRLYFCIVLLYVNMFMWDNSLFRLIRSSKIEGNFYITVGM